MAAPALVGQVANQAYAVSVVLTRTTTVGNTLILCVQHQAGAASVSSSPANTWVKDVDTQVSKSAAGEGRVDIWHCANANAITSVTITTATRSALNASLSEWSGIDPTTPVVNSNSSYAAVGSATQSATTVSANSGDLVIGVLGYYCTVRSDTLASPNTRLTTGNTSTTWLSASYHIATGTEGPSWTFSPNASTRGAATVAFSQVGGTPVQSSSFLAFF